MRLEDGVESFGERVGFVELSAELREVIMKRMFTFFDEFGEAFDVDFVGGEDGFGFGFERL